MTELPTFRYFPDPLGLKSIISSDEKCIVCKRRRRFVYNAAIYINGEEHHECLCPWCITDGRAYQELNIKFFDRSMIGRVGGWGINEWDKVPDEVIAEISQRTPSFFGWQQEHWWTHCHDAGEFLAYVDKPELEKWGEEAIKDMQEISGLDDDKWELLLNVSDVNGSPTGYLFRCLHCRKFGGYFDFGPAELYKRFNY